MVAYAMVVIMSAGPAAPSLNTTSGPEPCEVFPLSFDLDGDKAPESILYEGEWPDVSLRRIASTDAVAGHAGLSAEALYRVVAGEQRYRLDMLGLRKHVERPDPQVR
jgi:hypothetical protein